VTQSDICIENFDTLVSVSQTQEHFSVLGESSGFADFSGVFVEGSDVSYTLTGAGTECTGTFGDGLLLNICVVSVKVESTESPGTFNNEDYSCEVTYQRR
jgi:hypothetical protein